MKLMTMAVVTAFAAAGVRADTPGKSGSNTVTVYLQWETPVPYFVRVRGLEVASGMFAEIGVRIDWRLEAPTGGQAQREQAILIRIIAAGTRNLLGRARPIEGTTITVFYGSMKWAERIRELAPIYFAHVLVHEITHNLQGLARHSETGVMKELWSLTDLHNMTWKPLPFEPEDVEWIHKGLASRARRLAAKQR
jgi:hypothetical protein